jgi:hypothetical protein
MYRSACLLLLTMAVFPGCSSAQPGAAVASVGQNTTGAGCTPNGPLLGGPTDGGRGTTFVGPASVYLGRGFDGVPVKDSFAWATFDADNQTTAESFYWPEIPGDVMSAAVALKNQLAGPAALAAYKAKLPADAQGDGGVIIHHSSMGWSGAFQAAAVFDVVQTTPEDDGGDLYFDANGSPITTIM